MFLVQKLFTGSLAKGFELPVRFAWFVLLRNEAAGGICVIFSELQL